MNFIAERLFNKSTLVTIIRYALVALGGWLANEHNFDPGQWETISGALIIIISTVMGGTESAKDKAVIDGRNIAITKLPSTIQHELRDVVAKKPQRSWFDILIGK